MYSNTTKEKENFDLKEDLVKLCLMKRLLDMHSKSHTD